MNNYWSKFTRWMKYHREESNTQYIKRLCTKIADRSKIELINDIYSNLDDESREEALREQQAFEREKWRKEQEDK